MKSSTHKAYQATPKKILLFGAEAHQLEADIQAHESLKIVEEDPDIIVCYGGDGTLLNAELRWPGLPKAPILNSQLGHRCIPHPPAEVIQGLANNDLIHNEYTKLECALYRDNEKEARHILTPLNEINVEKGLMNSAVRYQLFLNDEPYAEGREILGDGFLVCTPFGSTAYFSKVTRGIFVEGIGIAFKATDHKVNHMVMPETTEARFRITRGPAELSFDSSREYLSLEAGDNVVVRKNPQGAIILTAAPVKRLNEPF